MIASQPSALNDCLATDGDRLPRNRRRFRAGALANRATATPTVRGRACRMWARHRGLQTGTRTKGSNARTGTYLQLFPGHSRGSGRECAGCGLGCGLSVATAVGRRVFLPALGGVGGGFVVRGGKRFKRSGGWSSHAAPARREDRVRKGERSRRLQATDKCGVV